MLKAISVLGYVVMAGGMLGLLFTGNLLSPSPFVIVPQVAGTALMIWARVTFGRRSFHFAANPTAGGLVTTGPYHYIRHPIYTGVCLLVLAGGLAHLSRITILLCAVVWGGAITRVFCEERLVVQQYPEYRQYAASTRRMIPHVF